MYKKIALLSFMVISISFDLKAMQLFTLEGTTGAGKSTLLKILAQEIDGIVPVYEPVEEVQDVGGHGNLLDLYYQAKERWTYLFQTYAFLLQDESCSCIASKVTDKILIGDRSIFSTYYVFGKMLNAHNIFTSIEWHVYRRWFNYAIKRSDMLPAGFIYLRTTPNVCFSRIKKRNRTEEQDAAMEYYLQEYLYHEKWLVEQDGIEHDYLKRIPVLILDGDQDFLNDLEVQKEFIEKIKNFINYYKK